MNYPVTLNDLLPILIPELVDLREKIIKFNITKVLNTKLAKGTPRETRTSLICLDIFRSFGTYKNDNVSSL